MLQMEIAQWAPKFREDLLKGTAEHFGDYVKKNGAPQLSMRNPKFKPGVQQLWWDVAGNRSFCLIYNAPHAMEPKGLFSEYKPLLDLTNFELINVMEINDVLAETGLAHWEDASTLPRLQIEITWWPPENREELMKRTAPFLKQFGAPPVTIHDANLKPGILQLWWDMLSNRSFCLLYDLPGFDNTKGILNEYKPGLNIMNFELVNIVEMKDVLDDAGLL